MNDKLFKMSFRSDDIPTWPCPICGSNSLSCSENNFNKEYKTPVDFNDPEFVPDWVEYVFSMNLKCTIQTCGARVMCVGTGELSQEYLDDGSGKWAWLDNFKVSFFEPSLRLFTPPKDTPFWVNKALETSFSTFFSSPSMSLSCLRTALEVLLDEMQVTRVTQKGSYLPLAQRINLLHEDFREIIEPANAIKWLGNDATHSGFQVLKTDVLDGYKIFEHILVKLYPEKKASIDVLVKRINDTKGVGRK